MPKPSVLVADALNILTVLTFKKGNPIWRASSSPVLRGTSGRSPGEVCVPGA